MQIRVFYIKKKISYVCLKMCQASYYNDHAFDPFVILPCRSGKLKTAGNHLPVVSSQVSEADTKILLVCTVH